MIFLALPGIRFKCGAYIVPKWIKTFTPDFDMHHVCYRFFSEEMETRFEKLKQVAQVCSVANSLVFLQVMNKAVVTSREMEFIERTSYNTFQTNTKSIGIYRLLRSCVLLNLNIVTVMKWARLTRDL